jgi:hypothetical protein
MRTSRRVRYLLGLGAAAALLVLIGLFVAYRGGPDTADSGGPHTYFGARPGDLTVGHNRVLNACNLLPPTQADVQFGRPLAPRLVSEKYADGSVPATSIGSGRAEFSTCYYDVLGGTVNVTLDAFADEESARGSFGDSVSEKVVADTGPRVTSADDLRSASASGVRGNYRYQVEVKLYPIAVAESTAKLQAVMQALGARLLANVDTPKVSSRPAPVPADVCAIYTAADLQATVAADNAIKPDNQVADTYPVDRTYQVGGTSGSRRSSCTRSSRFIDAETAQATVDVQVTRSSAADLAQSNEIVRERCKDYRPLAGLSGAFWCAGVDSGQSDVYATRGGVQVWINYVRWWSTAQRVGPEQLAATARTMLDRTAT